MVGFLFSLYIFANIFTPMLFLDGIEKRYQKKCLTRLDYLLMIIFFPMTIVLVTIFTIAKYSGRLSGKIAKKEITKNLWLWLNESPSKEKRKHDD